jgi:hypothetical protein
VIIDTRDTSVPENRAIKTGESYEIIKHSAVLFRETQRTTNVEERLGQKMREEHTVNLEHQRKAEELVKK